jgi:hypothetical protein
VVLEKVDAKSPWSRTSTFKACARSRRKASNSGGGDRYKRLRLFLREGSRFDVCDDRT